MISDPPDIRRVLRTGYPWRQRYYDKCAICGEDIYTGDKYIVLEGEKNHLECIRFNYSISDILDMCGWPIYEEV